MENKTGPTGAPLLFAPCCELPFTGNRRLINLEGWIGTIPVASQQEWIKTSLQICQNKALNVSSEFFFSFFTKILSDLCGKMNLMKTHFIFFLYMLSQDTRCKDELRWKDCGSLNGGVKSNPPSSRKGFFQSLTDIWARNRPFLKTQISLSQSQRCLPLIYGFICFNRNWFESWSILVVCKKPLSWY